MPGITAIHDPLRHVHPGAGDIRALIHICHGVHRPGMHTHAQLNLGMILQGPGDLNRTTHRRFRRGEKRQRHPIARRQTNQLLLRFGFAELFRLPHDG
ncbi:MAG: hypothetical protein M3128_11470, partial [Verrucomicrobiota bacterium]|nr:hypothetical protein [Verrucomicrobiota bacterium]